MKARSSVVGAACVAALLLAACGGDDSSSTTAAGGDSTTAPDGSTAAPGGDTTAPSGSATTPDDGEAVRGGVLTMGTFLPTTSLDPAVNSGFGVAGGIELLAVYDSIMRWDPDTGDYVPRMAESLESNEDHTVWTLTLEPGITFTDGTPFDAAAVEFNLNRFRAGQGDAPPCEDTRSCPSVSVASTAFMAQIASMEVIDDLTLEITTAEPWPAFPLVLAGEPGMVASPTALQAACAPDEAIRECSYGQNPVGAGPFMIKTFAPGESVELVRNDDYWGGEVYLDGVTFTSFGDGGGKGTAESLVTGEYDVAFLRNPEAIELVRDEGIDGGYSVVQQAGRMSWLNVGRSADSPTTMLEVRQAINAAIDRDALNQRVYDGIGMPGSEILNEDHRLYPGVPGVAYDLEAAKGYVEAAKAKGWDGKIRIACSSSESDRGIALASMLEAAGMTVDLNAQIDNVSLIELVNVKGDFDIACTGLPISNDDLGLLNGIDNNLRSTSLRNRTGYSSPEMDAALDQLRLAIDDDEKQAALATVSEIYNRDLPWLIEGAVEELVAWNDDVHGVVPTQSTEVFLDKAWLGE